MKKGEKEMGKGMDRIWAPWRVKYITEVLTKTKGCLFCRIAEEKKDKKNYIFLRAPHSYAVLNIYPYNNGHSLVLPYRHVGDLAKLSAEETADLFNTLTMTKVLLDKALNPAGYNIGMNLGRSGGAGFPDHLHLHIVPRWNGDVNFMPVIARTKVISQSLDELFILLVKVRDQMAVPAGKKRASRREKR